MMVLFLEFVGAVSLLAVSFAFFAFMGTVDERTFGRAVARRYSAYRKASASRRRADWYRSVRDPAEYWGSGGHYNAPVPWPDAALPGYDAPVSTPYPPPAGQPGYDGAEARLRRAALGAGGPVLALTSTVAVR